MAILNYSSVFKDTVSGGATIKGIYDKIGITSGTALAPNVDWVRIFVSPDPGGAGHFVTHGIDLTPDFGNHKRGLVPVAAATDLSTVFLRGDGWSALWTLAAEDAAKNALVNGVTPTSAQLIALRETYLKSTLVSADTIKKWITDSFSTNDAMRFKGVIDVTGTTVNKVNGVASGFPTYCEVGDTYKVNGSGILGGVHVETGDMLVCIKDSSTTTDINKSEYWSVVNSNIEYLASNTINGVTHNTYLQNEITFSIYAPSTKGVKGQVLISSYDASATTPLVTPLWTNSTNLTAGKVHNSLTAGTGIIFELSGTNATDYDGSLAITASLAAATKTTLGGVTVDGGSASGKETISVSNGNIYLTKDNVVNALGYTPAVGGFSYKTVIANTANAADDVTSGQASPFLNFVSVDPSGTGTVVGSTLFGAEPGSGLQISGTAGKIAFNTSVFTASSNGVVPFLVSDSKAAGCNATLLTKANKNSVYLLGSDAKWYNIPDSAFEGTWRNIKVNGTEILTTAPKDSSGNANPALNLVSGGKATLTPEKDTSGNYTGKIQINSTWRDIFTDTGNHLATKVGENNAIRFADSDGVWTHTSEETYTEGTETKTRTVIKSYLVWYNIDTDTYDGIV